MKRPVVRVVLGIVGAFVVVALLMTRPWSSQNSFRQMRIFHPADRVHNFRAMDELFPARVVPRSTHPHRFQTAQTKLPDTYSFNGEQRSVEAFLERTTTTGFLVLREDTLLAERYFLGATAETPFTSWSVAKSVVSLLIGVARDQGRIGDLTTSLSRYAPELEGSAYGRVPLVDALTMSSGIRFNEQYDDATSDIHTFFARVFYLHESVAHYLSSRSADVAPGTRFHYASADTLALGVALRGAIGKPLTTYLHDELWEPLGMEYDALWNVENAEGAELGFCCLNVRLRDYAKIGRLAARHGNWDGRQLVSEDWVRRSTRVEAARAPGALRNWRWGYQYQWWIPDGRRSAFMAAGVWGQFIYVCPEKGLVIVKTSVDPDFDAHGDEHIALFQTIEDSL